MFSNIYQGKRVLVTGDSGFKGSWLCLWLHRLGAELCGISLPLGTEYVHRDLLRIPMRSERADIRDPGALRKIFADFQPEAVFHLAAQPIVRHSYAEPAETFDTNVMGTVHILECCRRTPSVRAVVAVSSDKCYENREQQRGYKESDPMGGCDPYSASKGCTELAVSSYRRSFFDPAGILLASGRAGNVIGGGDWAQDRLVPDLMRAAAKGEVTGLRNPDSTRPWQHVLEPLSGYLALMEKLLEGKKEFACGWNFGPGRKGIITVADTAAALGACWSAVKFRVNPSGNQPHEAGLLQLDCSKAARELHWHGVLTAEETFAMTALWYRKFYEEKTVITERQLDEYTALAAERKLAWTM